MPNLIIIESDVVEGGPLPNFLSVWYILFCHPPNPTKKLDYKRKEH